MAIVALIGVVGCTQAQWPEIRPSDPCASGAIRPGEQVLRVRVGGRTRQALVWVPSGPGPHDVVVNLHSFRSEPRRQNHYSSWVPLAERTNAILVGPDGKSATWNAGSCCGKSMTSGVDEVAFLDAVVARIDRVACTSGRVLATGLGNGAMMAERWACESDVPDGVIAVGGSLQVDRCRSPRPIPYLSYHVTGNTQPVAPEAVGPLPLSHARTEWVRRNHGAPSRSIEAPGLSCDTWSGGAPTILCRVEGTHGGWPGAADLAVTDRVELARAASGGWAWMRSSWEAESAREQAPEASGASVTPEAVEGTLDVGVEPEEAVHP